MPKQAQTISVTGLDKESILSVCYSSFANLNWPIQFAGEDTLLGATPKSWKSNSQEIITTAADNALTVSSRMTGGESLDLAGKNKKNIAAFLAAFEAAKTSLQPLENENNLTSIAALREETTRIAAEEEAEAAEVNKAMNLQGSNLYATYTIIALNVIVFVLMAIDGAGIIEANGLVHLKWGSNFSPLTLSGDWWRLITNIFIHFGIIHLAMNMYSFFMVGLYLEPMLGKPRYVIAYLCTGVLASITSLWWHSTPANSAGASGAIFGMYGLFFAFLTTNLIPGRVRKALLQSIGIFIVYNLAYGMKGGIDNAAHIGGLLSGFIIGYLYVLGIKKEQQQQPATWMMPVVILVTAGIAYTYLQQHKSSAEERKEVLAEIKSSNYKDHKKFAAAYDRFAVLEDSAMVALKDTSLTDEARNTRLKEVSLPLWNKADEVVEQMQSYDISSEEHKRADNLAQYVLLREQEIAVIDSLVTGKTDAGRLTEVRHNIHLVIQALK